MAVMVEEMEWETEGEGPSDVGAESSYDIDFTAEDAAVRGVRDVVLPSNLLSAIAGVSPRASPGYGLLSSSNPALDVKQARDAAIPGPDSVDAGQESLIVAEDLDETPTYDDEQMQAEQREGGGRDTLAILQLAGVVPAILDMFKPRCTLHITYPGALELKHGDMVSRREIAAGRPSVAVTHHDRDETQLRGSLFAVIMVGLDSGQYLNWILANVPDRSITSSGVQGGTEEVVYDSPCPRPGTARSRYLFVAYSQSQRFHLSRSMERSDFDMRSFATMYGLETPVAAVYVTAAAR